MADEKLSEASSVQQWVKRNYGFDGLDYPKIEKIKHVEHVAQFASVCYLIGKNSKKAHTDFFDTNYTSSSVTVSKAAALIIKLLEMRTLEGGKHVLTRDDFESAGGEELFKNQKKNSPADYDQIVHDYIGEGGMVDKCQTLFPIKTENAKNAKMFKALTDNMGMIQQDHSQLLSVATDGTKTSLPLKDILGMRYTITECASKKWEEVKGQKSTGQFKLMDIKEELFESKRNLAIKTGKVATLGGATAMSIGAVVAGTFWPAVLLLPIYALGKKWLPDMFKALGNTWGQLENKRKKKREINRLDAQINYLTKWKELGKDPRKVRGSLSFKDRMYLRGIDMTCLKKQGKLMQEAVTTEITYFDPVEKKWKEKVQESSVEDTFGAISRGAGIVSDVTDLDKLVPADLKEYLSNSIKKLDPNTVTYEQMMGIASDIKEFGKKIPSGASAEIYDKYSDLLRQGAKHLVFGTALKSTDDYEIVLKTYLGDDSPILEVAKESDKGKDLPLLIKKYVDFASGEQSKLSDAYVDGTKTLEDYIYRTVPEPQNEIYTMQSPEIDSLYRSSTPDVQEILKDIVELKLSLNNETEFVAETTGRSVNDIVKNIGKITGDDRAKSRCDKLLKAQMKRVAYQFDRENSRKTYEAITGTGIKGSMTVSDALKKIGEITYENVETFNSDFYVKSTKFVPPETGAYVRSKAAKKILDLMTGYAEQNRATFSKDLNVLTDYLQKVNLSIFLNEYQKIELSGMATKYIAEALDKKGKDSALNFVQGFDSKVYRELLSNKYSEHGIYDFLNGSQKETQEVKTVDNKLRYLQGLGVIQSNLQFGNAEYKMGANDRASIGQILLLDEMKDFGEFKQRPNDDKLCEFFESKIKPEKSFGNLKGKTPPEIVEWIKTKDPNENPYRRLKKNLEWIESGDGSSMSALDRYAALIGLKYRALVDMKDCLTEIMRIPTDALHINDWLLNGAPDGGKSYYDAIVDLWNTDVMGKIDELSEKAKVDSNNPPEIREIMRTVGNTASAQDLMKKYMDTPNKGTIDSKELGA